VSDQTMNSIIDRPVRLETGTTPLTLLSFRHPWRPYQSRVLEAINAHLDDQKLHIVAAPGAGKTSLGLEVVRRLGHNTLILSPTRIIRNQWLERLNDFLPDSGKVIPDWCSTELQSMGVITSVTYQALHSRYKEIDEEKDGRDIDTEDAPSIGQIDQLASSLQANKIGTLVLDEAHHLQAAWWKALTRLTEQLPDLHIISLTATPPYDAVGHSWSRYQVLCGSIDEEISVPELVKAGTLCPHQDFCYMTTLGSETVKLLNAHDNAINDLVMQLENDQDFHNVIMSHPWVQASSIDITELLDDTEFAFGLLSYLKLSNAAIPESLLRPLGSGIEDLPTMNKRWWAVVLQRVLYGSDFDSVGNIEALRQRLKTTLRANQLLKGRQLQFEITGSLRQKLRHSPEKIAACLDIYRLEQMCRGEQLRQVILADFIRDENIDNLNLLPPQLGVWPLYRALILEATGEENQRFAMITGSYAIIHRQQWLNLQHDKLRVSKAPFSNNFLVVEGNSHELTAYVTERLIAGDIRVLVGTRALLGEGWDCPVVNSLVLASYVGAFVSTNQMRGRALRIDNSQPDKIASIWHLVAIHQDSESGLWDYISLYDRFRTFVGLHSNYDRIESGMERLLLPAIDPSTHRLAQKLAVKFNNSKMANQLKQLSQVKERWDRASTSADKYRVIPGIRHKQPPSLRMVHFKNTLLWLMIEAGLAFVAGYSYVMEPFQYIRIDNREFVEQLFMVSFAAGAIWALPKLAKALYGLVKHLPVDGSIRQMANTLKDALCDTGLIKTAEQKLDVAINRFSGQWMISLQGGDFYESSLFADCLNELLGPVENPRYLITRKSNWKTDYHPLPGILATHKDKAECFYRHWQKNVGKGQLIYTRREGGRAILLKARSRSFAGLFVPKHQRVDQWQ